jgi:hypothetical protein
MDDIYERGPPCGNDSFRLHPPSRETSSSRLYEANYENTSSSSLDYSPFMK